MIFAAIAGGTLLVTGGSACAQRAAAARRPTPTPIATELPPMEKILATFNTAAETRRWSTNSDAVMGGISTSEAGAGVTGTLTFSGVVRLENNGGFATVSGPSADRAGDGLAGYGNIALRVKGDGKIYQLWLNIGGRRLVYVARFTAKAGAWEEVVLPIQSFEPENGFGQPVTAARLDAPVVVGYRLLIADKQKGPFRLEIDWIKAVRK
jgi:hypothetical protein